MRKNNKTSTAVHILLIILASIALALVAVVLSVNYQYPESPACAGMLGAGFPLLYICDDWGGGSPTGSWGKITTIDVVNGGVIWGQFLLDLLFYTAMCFIAIMILRAAYRRMVAARNSLQMTGT
jgi:hypothetical protein